MKVTSEAVGKGAGHNGGIIQYTREELLKLRQQNTSALPNKDIAIVDYNYLAMCTGNDKPTHRGSKGLKRLLNTRKRVILRTPFSNLRTFAKATEMSTPRSKTDAKQIPGIMLTNCRSITLDKYDELKLLIEDKQPHVVMITESWLNDGKEQNRCIDGFQLLTSNRDSSRVGGGVAMLVHDSLNAKIVHRHTTRRFSTLWISLTFHHRTVIYGCIYHPKSKRTSESDEILKHVSDTMIKLSTKHSDKFVIGGDFNHLDMSDITSIFGLHNIVHFPTRNEAYLDKIFTNVPEMMEAEPEKLAPLVDSDHDIVYVPGMSFNPNSESVFQSRRVTSAAKILIHRDIAKMDWSLIESIDDLDVKATKFQSTITAIVNKHCPSKTKKKRHGKTPWFDDLARKLRNAKCKSMKKRDGSAKFSTKLLRNQLRNAKKRWITTKLEGKNPKALWTTINTLRSKPNSPKHKAVYTIDGTVMNAASTADALNKYFAEIGGTPSGAD